jgi:hypothetical protein
VGDHLGILAVDCFLEFYEISAVAGGGLPFLIYGKLVCGGE